MWTASIYSGLRQVMFLHDECADARARGPGSGATADARDMHPIRDGDSRQRLAQAAPACRVYLTSTLTGPTRQISAQYSRIERSEENLPLFAQLTIDMRVQCSRSW
jgi:hypothetical protein